MLRASRNILCSGRTAVAKIYNDKPKVVKSVMQNAYTVSACFYSRQSGDNNVTKTITGSGKSSSDRGIGEQYFTLEELTSIQKRILVSTKVYPNMKSMPNQIPMTKMRLAYDKFRVKVAILMTLVTLSICAVIMIEERYKRKCGTTTTWKQHAKSQLNMPENTK